VCHIARQVVAIDGRAQHTISQLVWGAGWPTRAAACQFQFVRVSCRLLSRLFSMLGSRVRHVGVLLPSLVSSASTLTVLELVSSV
jgi:hypothetical protein